MVNVKEFHTKSIICYYHFIEAYDILRVSQSSNPLFFDKPTNIVYYFDAKDCGCL